jgi:metal-responsive CopG/Arc/MetJ family transcriptional regulator
MEKNVKVTVTIPQKYYTAIEILKENSTWSRSLIIREAIRDFLDKSALKM